MSKIVRKLSEQWDDAPAKVVGRRIRFAVNLECGAGFLRMGADRNLQLRNRKKGVYRYRSHEEANA